MQTIKDILTYPNGTPIEAVQAKISKVFEYRDVDTAYGKKKAQSFYLEDSTGAKIKVSIWEHPDLKDHEGKEYVFMGGKGGKGILVKHGEYTPKGQTEKVKTVELSMGKAAQLTWVEVYHANNPGNRPAEAVSSPDKDSKPASGGQGSHSGLTPIHGAKVGMAMNNAVLLLNSGMEGLNHYQGSVIQKVQGLAVDLIRLSNDLESGRIAIEAPAPVKSEPAPSTPAKQEVPEEDVPY